MKLKKYNISLFSIGAFLFALMLTIACRKDDPFSQQDNVSLDAVIAEAQTLLDNSVEGTTPGDFKPGSKKELEEVLVWAKWRRDHSTQQSDIAEAAVRVQTYIAIFKEQIVKPANPWVKQENETYIEILDSDDGELGKVKELTNSSFTVEAKIWVSNLQQSGFSNNIFSNESSGPDMGFGVRYFSDGGIHIVAADGSSGWQEYHSGSGVITAGKWIHISLVNQMTKQILYVDGVEIGSVDGSYKSDQIFMLGNCAEWQDRVMNAMIKDFRLWSEARTESQISSNIDTEFIGTEENLAIFFPLSSDLGSELIDISGNFKAKLVGEVEWVADGIIPPPDLDYTAINSAVANATTLHGSIVEGTNDGDYPIGAKAYLQELIDEANALISDSEKQSELDDMVEKLEAAITLVQVTLVADSDGIYIDREDENSVGLRITPNYTPQGDYTVEFEVNLKTLEMSGPGELFNNGTFGCWVYGYDEETYENVLASGGLWNFTDAGAGWQGPKTDPLVLSINTWQHVAIVHDNTARTTKLFVDGVEKAEQTDIGAPNESWWGEIWLGNGWGKMNGSIKNFRMWDEVRASLNATIAGNEANLKIYFPLDKVAGVKFNDVTGNFQGEARGIKWNTN